MRKLLVTALAGGLLTAGGMLVPAMAQDVVTPVGTVSATNNGTGGSISADGAASNPGQSSGYIEAHGDATDPTAGDLCADDNGSPGASTAPTCASSVAP